MLKIMRQMSFKEKMYVLMAVISFVLKSLCKAAMFVIILNVANYVMTGSGYFTSLRTYWIVLASLLVLKSIFNTSADFGKHFAGFEIVGRLRKEITLRLKKFSLGFYTKERLGEISTIIHKDINNIESNVPHVWSRMFSDFITSLALATYLFSVNWKLGLAMVSLLPLAIGILVYGIKSNSRLQKESQDDLADMVSLFVEYSKGIPLLKAYSESSSFENNLKSSTRQFGESSKKSARSIANYIGKFSVALELCFAILVLVGGVMLIRNNISLTQFLVFILLSTQFYKPFASLEGYWVKYLVAKDSYDRVMSVMNTEVIKNPENPIEPKSFEVEFVNANFSYEENDFELKNINTVMKEGSLVALVGPSGSGKTTVTNLLLRFYDLNSGQIKIGGVDIKDMDYNHLLENISIVMQNVILFADTIYENIKVGKKDATRAEVIAAAKNAMIHEFIMTLPDGYETMVGENGAGLSGGQKQRLSIARALLRNAPIVILDEATSNVDPVNERKIQIAISNLAKGRTLIVIAHHLNTIKTAEQILVFYKGEIVEAGDFNELIAKRGLFKSLWDSQEKAKEWLLCS